MITFDELQFILNNQGFSVRRHSQAGTFLESYKGWELKLISPYMLAGELKHTIQIHKPDSNEFYYLRYNTTNQDLEDYAKGVIDQIEG